MKYHNSIRDLKTKKRRLYKEALYERQAGLCAICSELMLKTKKYLPDNGPLVWSLDHIVPRSKGGAKTLSNFRLTHRQCNLLRGDIDV